MTNRSLQLVKDDFPCSDEVRLHREKVRQEATSLIQVPPSTPIEKYIKVGVSCVGTSQFLGTKMSAVTDSNVLSVQRLRQ